MNSIKKQLSLILIKTFVCSTIVTLIGLALLLEPQKADHNDHMQGLPYGIAIFITLFLTFSALTVYLNLHSKIRNSAALSFLSFHLLPCLIAILTIASFGELKEQWAGYSLMVLPFIALLSYYFFNFRKNSREKEESTYQNTI